MASGKNTDLGVLFLCTGNSARSLIAEALLRDTARERIRSYSAGSHPSGAPHPLALEILHRNGHDTHTLRSKSWNEFAAPAGPRVDLVLTLCDAARDEICPVLHGVHQRWHWGLPDPASAPGSGRREAFDRTYRALRQRIDALVAVDWEGLPAAQWARALDALDTP